MKHWTKSMMAAAWLAGLGYASPALADCTTDADCGDGFVCVSHEYEIAYDCDTEMPVCDDDDETCVVDKTVSPCEGTEVVTESYCERASCEADADCGDEMICIEHIEEWCTASDMDTDSLCIDDNSGNCTKPAPSEPECGVDIHKECGYKYEEACEADADCGEGFACKEVEICSCSHSAKDMDTAPDDTEMPVLDTDGAMDTDDSFFAADSEMSNPVSVDTAGPEDESIDTEGADDYDPMPVEPECSCEPTGEKQCELKEIECAADSDCPSGMFCDDAVSSAMCTAAPGEEPECEETEEVRHCYPNGYIHDVGATKNDGDTAGPQDTEDSGNIQEDSEGPNPVIEIEKDTEVPISDTEQDTDTSDAEEDTGTENTMMNIDDDIMDTSDDVDKSNVDADENSADSAANPGGCSVATPAAGGSSAAGAFLGLFGLLAFTWRRR